MTRAGIPLDTITDALGADLPAIAVQCGLEAHFGFAPRAWSHLSDAGKDGYRAIAKDVADALAATPEPALSDTDKALLRWGRQIVKHVLDGRDHLSEEANEVLYDARGDVNIDGILDDATYDDVSKILTLLDLLIDGPDTTDRSLITRAADYIEADRAWRDSWTSDDDTPEGVALVERLRTAAQDARMRFGDEDLVELRRIGAR